MSGKNRKTGKVESTRRLAKLLGMKPPSAAGGTIPRPWLAELLEVAFGARVDLRVSGKRDLIKTAIEMAGGTWDPKYISSSGGTIAGEAVQYLYELLRRRRESAGGDLGGTTSRGAEDIHSRVDYQQEDGLSDDQDRAQLDLQSLAQQMEALSQPGELPSGVEPQTVESFSAEDVRFDSNDWLLRLLEVQPWLNLDQPLSIEGEADPASLTEALFASISRDAPAECYKVGAGGVAILQELGVESLEAWLSHAVNHRQAYETMREEGRSRSDASDEWRTLWEETVLPRKEPVAITAKVDTWRIRTISEYAGEELLDLNPSYQRDVVWSNPESQLLIESVLRGIPLPSVIFSQGTAEDGSQTWQIVDGKQRLTALLRFLGKHPDGRRAAESMEGGLNLYDTDFAKFARKNQLSPKDINDHFMPFRLSKKFQTGDPLSDLSGKYYSEIRNKTISIAGQTTLIRNHFESAASDYRIPVIIYERTSIRDIHHVFSLYNKQGKKLNAEEIRNAVYHHLPLATLLLVLSGDRNDADTLAPYAGERVRQRVTGTGSSGQILQSLGFGVARFKRTKVLSWTTAILLHKPNQLTNGAFTTPSTAMHIDAMLEDINGSESVHPLSNRRTLKGLAELLQDALVLHREADAAWHPGFRRKAGQDLMASKWEELAVVASLLTTCILVAAGAENVLLSRIGEVRALTQTLAGPSKSQNRTQWAHIARVVTRIVDHLEVDDDTINQALTTRFGYSCLPTLRVIALSEG